MDREPQFPTPPRGDPPAGNPSLPGEARTKPTVRVVEGARLDIQVLRAIAVLVVVLYHAGLPAMFGNGYLGVDVFFVVSGFLITQMVAKGLRAGKFSFVEFYVRRARRLLPALYATLTVTSIAAVTLLEPSALAAYFEQLIGAVSFSANFILPTQFGYFESGADTSPLLHIWSLSLEEQYYFVLPLLLFATPFAAHRALLITLCLGSFLFCLYLLTQDVLLPFLWRLGDISSSDWAFYLLAARAWELLAGSVCAYLVIEKGRIPIGRGVIFAALAAIVLTTNMSFDSLHPRMDALIVVLATCLILVADSAHFRDNLLTRSMAKVGDWSYSIYLVHWPLFVFIQIAFAEAAPAVWMLAAAAVAIPLGYLQYQYVEEPYRGRRASSSRENVRFVAALTAIPAMILSFVYLNGPIEPADDELSLRIAEDLAVNYGLSRDCDPTFSSGDVKEVCITGENPRIALWGDSFAMHLALGIANYGIPIAQLTKSTCGPVMGATPTPDGYHQDWAAECRIHNERSIAYIESTQSIDLIILSSTYRQYVTLVDTYVETDDASLYLAREETIDFILATVRRLIKTGKRVFVISPPPRSGFNIGRCLERKDRKLFTFLGDCRIDARDYREFDADVIEVLQLVEAETDASVVWLDKLLCDGEVCRVRTEEHYLYRDKGHLTRFGSQWIFAKLQPALGL